MKKKPKTFDDLPFRVTNLSGRPLGESVAIAVYNMKRRKKQLVIEKPALQDASLGSHSVDSSAKQENEQP